MGCKYCDDFYATCYSCGKELFSPEEVMKEDGFQFCDECYDKITKPRKESDNG